MSDEKISKILKWGASVERAPKVRSAIVDRLCVVSGKSLCHGKDDRVLLGEGVTCSIGARADLSPGCVIDVADGKRLEMENDVYINEECWVTAGR